jgi:hypothetical protein
MVEILERRTSTTEHINRQTVSPRPAVQTTSPAPARPDDVAPVARTEPPVAPAVSARAGLRADEARWLPLVVPGFALLLLACTALILGLAAAGA